jgi:lipid A ethanolaminephosphotransferase
MENPSIDAKRDQPKSRVAAVVGWRLQASVETAIVCLCLFWLLSANGAFLAGALKSRNWSEPDTWALLAAMVALILALHAAILGVLLNRWTLKPLGTVLLIGTALAAFYMQRYSVVLDPSMLRNVLRTDLHEAGELLSWPMLLHVMLYAGLPTLLLWRVQIVQRPLARALLRRLAFIFIAVVLGVVSVLAAFQPLASLMRNQKELRYQLTPANYLYSLASVVAGDVRGATRPREPIGLDAKPGPSWAQAQRPRLIVLVVGETARAANWGLSGYQRQTTPELAKLPVINFAQVTSCGTNTEVSVPCMFAPVGRRDYDEARIKGQEGLLHVLARAGAQVRWVDNQSGCKGVCDGLPTDAVATLNPPGLCSDGRCLDEALLPSVDSAIQRAAATQRPGVEVLVLHQLGNHGPAYFRRYPPAFARFTPACRDDDLQRCSLEEIRNAYDNALLYTDHLLASVVARLQAASERVDTAMYYVSDHGESLGENRLFLHGMPYAIAPDVQKRVPMVMWFSESFSKRANLDTGCVRERAQKDAFSHDHLFHTLLGLADVQTSLYEPTLDALANCRKAAP